MLHNLIMVDFAAKDRRSASAMLRGTGDSREALWLSYEESHSEIFDKIYLMESFGG